MITLDNVSRWYPTKFGRKHVLKDVSAVFPRGRNVGICGRNGSGKSTLIKVIAGSSRPDAGTVRVAGSVSWPLGLAGGVQGSMTGRENTRFVCWVHGLHGVVVRRIEGFVQDFSEIGKDFDLPVKNYSSGMRSRLTFGISMAFDFDWYLLDEVGAPGDEAFKRKSKAALDSKLGRSNYLIVSQDIRLMAKTVDTIVLVHGGGIRVYANPSEAIAPFFEIMKAA